MSTSKDIENARKLKSQLDEVSDKYYKLWEEGDNLRTTLRNHFSTIVAAFLGIIVSLHKSSANLCLERYFFLCILLCVLSLMCLVISSCENLYNTKLLMKVIKKKIDKATNTMTPMKEDIIASPKRKIFTFLFWLGCVSFCMAIILFTYYEYTCIDLTIIE
jgi:cell division protein FtsL